ncbi:flagellar motor switch protein FliM [Sporanaerobium hydrogeniformans]|uniref:Flagellar motor switch protein FliM n=1 Tax=Sporanaerobium hydrogeniformans TaxID=3072179 RepID=A0AC61DGD5_9FIRM|nr:flagellar motor switch protein FliM [Sporanaerobium hydrogeniformans]PHV71751.1 flagellar motor switch protein FliM [Sporanaerobium hydrogeniformans]
MGEVLSQSEIDDLFKALNTGELDVSDMHESNEQKPIKAYDFARPSKFSKEQLRTLEIIFESYARLVSTYLSGHLRTMVSVEVMNSEAVTYSEFSNALINPVILAVTDFRPLKGSILMELSPNMGYTIIDRVLGGSGQGLERIREFTDIEHVILEKIFLQFVQLLVEPWENVVELDPQLEKIETNSQVVQIISPNEIIALVTLNVKIGNVAGMMNICIPHLVLESIMDKINTRYWFSQKEQELGPSYGSYIQKMVEKSPIPIKAILGKTHITIEEFLELQRGDIIKLDKSIDADLDVCVGNILKFRGIPGEYKNKVAIKINQVVMREDE